MYDAEQLALLQGSVKEWNGWREAYPKVRINLCGANLSGTNLTKADLRAASVDDFIGYASGGRGYVWRADFRRADFRRADLIAADLTGANLRDADLTGANLTGANLTDVLLAGANLTGANLTGANLTGADLTDALLIGADFTAVDLRDADPTPVLAAMVVGPEYLMLALTITANLGSIIQALDVIERRWREHKVSTREDTLSALPKARKVKEIMCIHLEMDDGSRHSFDQWVSDPDKLKEYISIFSSPSSKVKPLRVVFEKFKGSPIVVDVDNGRQDNQLLEVLLSYLEDAK